MKTDRISQGATNDGYTQTETLCVQLLRAAALFSNSIPGTDQDYASRLKSGVQAALRTICGATHWPLAYASILTPHDGMSGTLPADLWYIAPGEGAAAFQEAIDAHRLRLARSWHVRVIRAAKPVIFCDLSKQPESRGKQAARELGLRSAVGFATHVGDKISVVCEFFASQPLRRSILWEEAIATVAASLGKALEFALLEQTVRELQSKLVSIQDEERRRLARELHDTTGQNLAVIINSTEMLCREAQGLTASECSVLAECAEFARASLQEIRTFSYLLHPPLLEELGVFSALRLFVEGFAQRSGIAVRLEMPEGAVTMPRETELTLFRVVQESLSNVHKHANSSTATVRIVCEAGSVKATVEDEGTGIPFSWESGALAPHLGVGISGMQERVKQCGGHLKLNPRAKGTQLEVNLPLPELARAAAR